MDCGDICQSGCSTQGVVLMCSNYELKLSNTADGRRVRDRRYDMFFSALAIIAKPPEIDAAYLQPSCIFVSVMEINS